MHALSEFGRLWKDKYLLLVFNLVAAGLVTLPAMWRVTDPDDSNERSSSICNAWEVLFFKTRTNNILEDQRPAHKRCVNLRSGQRDVQNETNSRNSKRG